MRCGCSGVVGGRVGGGRRRGVLSRRQIGTERGGDVGGMWPVDAESLAHAVLRTVPRYGRKRVCVAVKVVARRGVRRRRYSEYVKFR